LTETIIGAAIEVPCDDAPGLEQKQTNGTESLQQKLTFELMARVV